MAAKRAKKAAEAEEFEPRSAAAKRAMGAERDYSKYRDKDATDLQVRFAQWLLENVEPDVDSEDDFCEGVRLGVALRMQFQASPENQRYLAEQREAREAAAAEDDEEEKPKPRRRSKAKAKPEPEPEPVDDEDDDDGLGDDEEMEEEEPKPKPKARRVASRASTTGPAKPAPSRRRKPAAKATGAAPY